MRGAYLSESANMIMMLLLIPSFLLFLLSPPSHMLLRPLLGCKQKEV